MKKMKMYILTMMCILLVGCGGENDKPDKSDGKEKTNGIEKTNEIEENNKNESAFSYADLRGKEFTFCSGAGAWQTNLTIADDGSFEGLYMDSDMGSTGKEYPDGTRYLCKFSGQLSELTQVNERTYTAELEDISYENPAGKEECVDGVRYVYSDAYGLDNAGTIYFYLPGTKKEDLSEDCLSWISQAMYDDFYNPVDELNFVCLYNKDGEQAFYSSDLVENFLKDFQLYEEEEKNYLDEAQNLVTQTAMTENAYKRFELWDMALNEEWRILMNILSTEEKEKLKAEEREWISNKEKAVKEAGADAEGGSLQPMLENDKAADLTKTRVYELKKIIEQTE